MSSPPQVADPAGLCAILFNGGGGGETLPYIVNRLVSIFGLSEIRAEIDRITMQMNETQQDSEEKPSETQSALCDVCTDSGQPVEHGSGAQAGGQAGGGGGGEGGEDGQAEEV